MSPPRRVCMFVYNTMVHDARVRKEARTLAQAGYAVTVLAVLDPKGTPREEEVAGFHITRLSRSLLGISRRELSARVRRQPAAGSTGTSGSSASPTSRGNSGPRPPSRVERILNLSCYPLRRVLVYLRLVRAGLRTQADVYHAHDLNTLLMAWTASRLRRVPLVYDSHEIETGRARMKLRWWAAFLEGALIGRAARVICTNRTRADYTQHLYHLPPPVILRNLPAYCEPQASGLIHERLNLDPETKVVLYQGGLQPDRGLEEVIEAAREIQGGTVVLLGSGRLKPALQRRVKKLGLEPKVRFRDAVPVDELPAWTACGYVGLQVLRNTCLNHYSSLSNKLLEYLMAGVPVIASDLPEMRRVIEETQAGLLVETSDPHQIAAAVNRLLDDPGLRQDMSERARRARGRYSWEQEEQVLLDLYAGLADSTPPALTAPRSTDR